MEQIEFDFITDFAPLCGCGCGQCVMRSQIKPYNWNIFVLGHHMKLQEHRDRVSMETLARCEDPEYIAMLRTNSENMWQNPEFYARMLIIRNEQVKAPGYLEAMSARTTEQWKNPEYSKMMSDKGLARWQDPEMVKKILKGMGKSPNNLETDFNEATSDSIRYTGDGTFWCTFRNKRNKNPDFKVTDQSKVIELFGDYWHKNEDVNELIGLYAQIGIQCLVIWESEWKNNREEILQQVEVFINE